MARRRRRKAPSNPQGTYGSRPAEWDALCGDVKVLILEKLNLKDLARVGILRKEFQFAYLRQAYEVHAALIAAREEAYGEGVVSGFVTALRRAMCGLSPCLGVDSWKYLRNPPVVLITGSEEPRYGTWDDKENTVRSGKSLGFISDDVGDKSGRSFEACLERPGDRTRWSMEKYSAKSNRKNWELRVELRPRGVAPTLGVLLAVCLGSPGVLPTNSRRGPPTINLRVWGGPSGVAGLGEAEDSLALLRSLEKSINIKLRWI